MIIYEYAISSIQQFVHFPQNIPGAHKNRGVKCVLLFVWNRILTNDPFDVVIKRQSKVFVYVGKHSLLSLAVSLTGFANGKWGRIVSQLIKQSPRLKINGFYAHKLSQVK